MKIRIEITNLRIRKAPSLSAEIIGFAKKGEYEYTSTKKADGYK